MSNPTDKVEQKLDVLIRALKPDLGFGNALLGDSIAQIEDVRAQIAAGNLNIKAALNIELQLADSVLILATGSTEEVITELDRLCREMLNNSRKLLSWGQLNQGSVIAIGIPTTITVCSRLTLQFRLILLTANRTEMQQFARSVLRGMSASLLFLAEIKADEEKRTAGNN